ncbi:phosphatase [Parapedobacter defluvii]|uniref:Phosphatase n=1 Tax=Parapedobacter defluvii TaxID=2045106 RepID=A0ABQ1LFF2_9SPHI|nr:HAD hydrolase-like protein [Parapedobacter defluvii]GGC23757.1 phosphatase [Parapedobacter defluvii]
MSIALVVFDIAGTTVRDNDNVGEAFQAALDKFGYQIPLDQINPYMGYEKNKAIREILKAHQGDTEVIDAHHVAAIHRSFVGRMVRYYETKDIQPLPNVEETFARLRNMGIKIALNTGFSRNIADVIVEKLGWFDRELIDYMVASDEVPQGRPYPDMIRELMKRAGIADASQVAKVGDTEVDVNEGKNVGCRYVIGVTTGAYTREQLEEYHPTHIIDDIGDVVDIVSA